MENEHIIVILEVLRSGAAMSIVALGLYLVSESGSSKCLELASHISDTVKSRSLKEAPIIE